MGLAELPEIKLARRLILKHGLSIPFELDTLVQLYAKLIYKSIPIEGVDGVSVNIKVPGKVPKIVVNTNIPRTRQKFTLAHELGHIIIPWHLGTIVDELQSQSYKDLLYSIVEQEANRFAAELLMPKDWALDKFEKCDYDPALLHNAIVKIIGVSDLAAAIRLCEILPPHFIFAAEEQDEVIYSGSSNNTNAFLQQVGDSFDDNFYPYIEKYSTYQAASVVYHWWKLSTKIEIDVEDQRTWREILDSMVADIQPIEGAAKFKMTINAIMANAHGNVKRQEDYCLDTVVSACIYRLRREKLEEFTSHHEFEKFVKIRAKDFFVK